ncbi:HEAT repeat domain-containing protein [Lyngbya aestuarii]|uniref:HEAT repeat domain-containing protein n=1 Tax=Lyngbya aestuarii TaxID=118322 RepID=UPI00403D5DDD
MKLLPRVRYQGNWLGKILQLVNLRPEEGERTLLMFAFYTATSIGLLWFEHSAVALFLGKYGAEWLPVIYIASALMCIGLGSLYSWLQSILPMRQVLVVIALLTALPLLILRLGLFEYLDSLIIFVTIFLLRLWMDAVEVLNDLNTQIAANQLFNIREIKRTYPLISSGLLVADVISGFSLPLLLLAVGLNNVLIVAALMMLVGAGTLFYLSQRYQQAFPDSPGRQWEDAEPEFAAQRPTGPLRRYIIPLFAFSILGEALFLLIEFQYLGQLEVKFETSEIAGFLGLFSGIVGICELITQWFFSSRAIDKLGVFGAAMLLPASLSLVGVLTLTGILDFLLRLAGSLITVPGWITGLFVGLILLRFLDELLRYTLIAGVEPVFFQPLPERIRNSIQTSVDGIAVPITTGITGISILATIWIAEHSVLPPEWQSWVFISAIVLFSIIWLLSAWLLRSSYVNLLVQSAEERGRLGFPDVALRAFKRAVVDVLEKPGKEADKRSCIQLLCQIDPENVGEVLSPLLAKLSVSLQRQSLEAMLEHPHPDYLDAVTLLIEQTPPPEVLALALRYLWLTQTELDLRQIKPYLQEAVHPTVRATAAALILRRGTPTEKAEATQILRRLITSKNERERMIGTRALGDTEYLQALRLYIPNLLKDESLRVRCAVLEVIATRRLSDYYPSLIRGLYYKYTRDTAQQAMVRLGDEAIPLLVELGEDLHKPDLVRLTAWNALGEIGTPQALEKLVQQLMTSWGSKRRNILRVLLKIPKEAGIETVLDQLGRSGVEALIEQELLLLGQIYAALLDLSTESLELESLESREADLLRSALQDLQTDLLERCFLLMKFLYPPSAIQAAAYNLKSESRSSVALALEILDNTLDIPQKRAFLVVLDRRVVAEKLACLVELVPYQPMSPGDRLRRLIELRHFLSGWSLACCFHLARAAHYPLAPEATLVCLSHPKGFVREAVLAYLKEASPRACSEFLPTLKHDPDRLVAAQAQQIIGEWGLII